MLCYACLHQRHKSQNAVTVEVWMKTKLDQLKVSQEKIDEMIRQRKEKIDDLQNSVQTGKTNVERRHSVKVVLDPKTAHHLLSVSEDCKQVQYERFEFPVFQRRVDCLLNVLAKEGFNANTFYHEVQVKGKTEWDSGVASESINRKGEIRLSPQNGYWTICLRKGNEYTANAGPAVVLNPRKKPQKIGIFVNYEVGLVAFYDVEESVEIHTFTGCTFTEKLFPFFSPGTDVDGNEAPLIITPVITGPTPNTEILPMTFCCEVGT
uniref:B30.2/SPRY domain-containing protein n=1 Tax=Gadus morhua TaxID=8049 RepID=A0A8C4YZX3_GADMO